jgi:acyl-CoA synthetase (NDP forming)
LILNKGSEKVSIDISRLNRVFNPQTVAVVGDSGENDFRWLRAQRDFKGKLYSVQVNPKSIEGIKALGIENYTSLTDIPETVDLVIVAVPRAVAPRILDECIRKEVAAAHFFTSGFSETDTEEGINLENSMTDKAKAANFYLIGPNCMGIFNPRIGLKQSIEQYSRVHGPIGFISQSGTHAITFSLEVHLQGMDIDKSVSFGNGVVLDSTDYLEYFGQDPDVKVIGMYLEGVKDGRRFLKVLREVSECKPVVIWKGGRTEEGERAVASHTGSLAVSQKIWDAAIKQNGGVNVTGMEEMIDTLKILYYFSPPKGINVAVTGGSGGQSVAVADAFAEEGLRLPQLSQESYNELSTFFSLIGGAYLNPIDTGNQNRTHMKRILGILERDKNTDILVLLISARYITMGYDTTEHVESSIELMGEIKRRSKKPVMSIVSYSTDEGMRRSREIIKKFQKKQIAAFPTLVRGARALSNALEYYRLRNGADLEAIPAGSIK